MKENLKDILTHLNPEVDQETLLSYLQGKLNATEQHEVEKQLMDSDFEAEALEGLQSFSDKRRLKQVVEQLNRDLKQKTKKKNKFREKLRHKSDPSLWAAVLIILLLIVISYFIIHRFLKGG